MDVLSVLICIPVSPIDVRGSLPLLKIYSGHSWSMVNSDIAPFLVYFFRFLFIDTDAIIEHQQQKSITELCSEHGKDFFHNCETEVNHRTGHG